MICVYTPNETDYEKNGAAVLNPSKCKVKEEAGGAYELTMEHPIDVHGVWSFLQPGHVIKVPVPATTAESAFVGEDVDIYTACSSGATVYAKPQAPSGVTYPAWSASSGPSYVVGSKVTLYGDPAAGSKVIGNYQMIALTHGTDMYTPPNQLPSYWQSIGTTTAGAAVVTKLAAGTEFFEIRAEGDYWLYIQTMTGYQGYVQTAYCTYTRTEEVTVEPEHTVRSQLFRIYEVKISTDKKSLSVSARHVSYDLAGNLAGDCVLTNVAPSSALARLRDACICPTSTTIATTLTEDENGTFTGDFSWKNPINCLLDPDTGVVDWYKAKLFRDNWDIFIYPNTEKDRGFKIRYGTNMKAMDWKRNSDELINRVIPVAKNSDDTDLMLPEVFVDSPIFDSYPVARCEYLQIDGKVGGDDGEGGTWTEETLCAHMREEAEKRFSVDNADKVKVEIKVNFVILGDTEEYRQLRGLQKLYLYDTVGVIDDTLSLDTKLQVRKVEWDAILQRYDSITLGDIFDRGGRSVAGYNIANGCINFNKLSAQAVTKIKEAVT